MRRLVLFPIAGLLIAGFSANAVASHTGWVFGSGGPRISLTLTEYKFTPSTITLEAETPVDLVLENKGIIAHNFMVYGKPAKAPKGAGEWWEYAMANSYLKDMGEIMVHSRGKFVVSATRLFEIALDPGERVTLTFVPGKKGRFEFGCHLATAGASHYDAGMKGTLVVK